ncbi:MAG TPA: hypothetical protein VEG38_07435 [Acidimicrobiia bacterium]|nr:hypothetical protein [Acidimicrobiia bacterium]
MDKHNKPQQTSEEEVTAPTPAPSLQARSPYRPLSRRRRQEQVAQPPSAVERPAVSMTFDASPTRISAALAKAGASPEETVLAWKAGRGEGTSDGGGVSAGEGTGFGPGADGHVDVDADAELDLETRQDNNPG